MQIPIVEEDMKKKFLTVSALLVAVALISIAIAPPATGADPLITVLNPAISSKLVERIPLTPRTPTLEGKTIYLVDLQWGGPEAAYSVFEEMQGWFSRNMPSVKVEIRRSAGGPFGDDAALRKEIAQKKAGGVVIGIGG
jgi:hypothetical protein